MTANDLDGLNAAVLSAFPVPLLRTFRGALKRETAKEMLRFAKSQADTNSKKPFYGTSSLAAVASENAEAALRTIALHRFRVLLTPRLAGGKTLPTPALTTDEKQTLTLAIAADALHSVSELETELPAPTRAGFEKSRFSGQVTGDGRLLFYIFVSSNDPSRRDSRYTLGNVTPISPSAAPPEPPK